MSSPFRIIIKLRALFQQKRCWATHLVSRTKNSTKYLLLFCYFSVPRVELMYPLALVSQAVVKS